MLDRSVTYDHDHDKCVLKVCPRCGWDPLLNMGKGGIRQDTRFALSPALYSCSVCDACWVTYEADMTPEEREMHLIEEAPELT